MIVLFFIVVTVLGRRLERLPNSRGDIFFSLYQHAQLRIYTLMLGGMRQ